MLQHTEAPRSLEATYKAREVEGFRSLLLQPDWISISELFREAEDDAGSSELPGWLFGVVAGHLYYYHNLSVNIAGMVLHVCATRSTTPMVSSRASRTEKAEPAASLTVWPTT